MYLTQNTITPKDAVYCIYFFKCFSGHNGDRETGE